jgi:hypothetical protein
MRRGLNISTSSGRSTLRLTPDLLVFSTGYHSRLPDLSGGLPPPEGFLSRLCPHDLPNLFLIGFARPIIGNIPSISEIQARTPSACWQGRTNAPTDMKSRHEKAVETVVRRVQRDRHEQRVPGRANPVFRHSRKRDGHPADAFKRPLAEDVVEDSGHADQHVPLPR